MNEIKFANKIRHALNEGARVDNRIAGRLRAARERALEARKPEPTPGWTGGSVLSSFGGFSLRVVLPAVLLVIGLVGIYTWQEEQRAADIEELDTALLTDDLPIDAYLDRGFEAWAKKTAAGQ